MIVHMVTSQRAEKEDSNYFVEEIRLFSNLDAAKIFAKHKFEEVLKIFGLTKDDVEIEEVDYLGNGNTADEYYLHANFREHGDWSVWVIVEKKEVE